MFGPSPRFEYVGEELELFRHAVRWKSYFASKLRRHIGGDVLEVGAGIGGTTRLLCTEAVTSWTAIEPDAEQIRTFSDYVKRDPLRVPVESIQGTIADVPAGRTFDSILYIDVLEHVEDDAGEVSRSAGLLRLSGTLIVLAPAHPFLFTSFDQAIGHHRRYNAQMLARLSPPQLRLDHTYYLDSVGMLASAANRVMLRQNMPGLSQLMLWDRVLVPMSRIVDAILMYRVGKTVVAIWHKVK